MNRLKELLSNSPRAKKAVTAAGAIAIAAVLVTFGRTKVVASGANAPKAALATTVATTESTETAEETIVVPVETTLSAEQSQAAEEKKKEDTEKDNIIAGYSNLGIANVDGFVNVRKDAKNDADVIGKLYNGSACNIVETREDGWLHITSGEVDGYVRSEYIRTGDDAKQAAKDLVKKRAQITGDRLNVRSAPSADAESVEVVLQNERYEVLEDDGDWVKIDLGYTSGYINKQYATIAYSLNEAQKLDLKSMILNAYDHLGISDVQNYLNIRETPDDGGKVVGKLPSKAAGNILEESGDWYKIQSGGITGYVKKDYILTGDAANEEALKQAQLVAVVNTDILNVRSAPSTDADIWTQITNAQKYPVVAQQDGWVEIELENDNNAFVATDFVDVRYALDEAVPFTPEEVAEENTPVDNDNSANAPSDNGNKNGNKENASSKSSSRSSRRSQVVSYALQYLGNPYVWGGTSLTNGADCSGFTMGVMNHFGVDLPHYSGAQASMGSRVSAENVRPGDLVFYANRSGTINHVGIYIGNGQIVNAASRRSGIKISNWNYRKPAAIRNVLGD